MGGIQKTSSYRRRDFCRLVGLVIPSMFLTRTRAIFASGAPSNDPLMKPIVLLDAPSNLGLRPLRENHEPGVWRLPQSLRARGILQKLGARDAGAVPRLPYSPDADAVTGFLNGPRIAEYTTQLATRIGALLEENLFPFLIGGEWR